MISSKHFFLITLTITVALLSATTTTAQLPSCASKLAPCAQYLKSKKPPASCCNPLKEAVTKDHACLCKLYENPNPTSLSSLGINVTQALDLLPKYCKIRGDVTACKAKNKNGVSRVAWTGMSSLLVLFASFVLA
ncbi:non-specific lipid transfer protein GPI-anchored 9-like [Lycium barbarum]|uniref:non-specific lipid transfer protein GPI-anchored 9-like n=1 Tax=Lycium barbarum TaxID=112863 RepID=UPI00293EBBD7|nr:non-specific lipid transfer protein GPI-anchored 9-like [Lycium barbarum]